MPKIELFGPVSEELEIVEAELSKNINTRLDLLRKASTHLIAAGGKRLRPAFALLAARVYQKDLGHVVPLAVALELIHMASLVHDDVIDNSLTRRGTDTVKRAWGNRMSIYAGNYILARSLALVAGYQRSDIVDVLADASMDICEGEIIQMMSAYNVNLGLKNYLRRIERKTALLISVSCQLGAMVSNADEDEVRAVKNYGYYLGMAFQITDDILDFVADEQALGKPTGSDIRQGVITLPAWYALRCAPEKEELAVLLSSPEACKTDAEHIIDIVVNSDGIEYAYHVSQHFARKAEKCLDMVPDGEAKEAFLNISDFILDREF
jgi:heptaprenyl diphosphate synthase